jgi:NADPH-dependent glutamate synthase beta subunit-like oxidoreductase/ferredoxin
MVGGQVFFRGRHKGFSAADAGLVAISDDHWAWLAENLEIFLNQIHRPELLESLTKRSEWNLLIARSIRDKAGAGQRSMASFRKDVWDRELGFGGLIGDLTTLDRRPIPLIPTGDLRRFVPEWANRKYLAPCEATCPSGIPVQERWQLIREGRIDEAVDLALAYTPFPATVCGYLCPNPCMQACTRQTQIMEPVDTTQLGKASINAGVPDLPPLTGRRIGVIGGGPAGISIAWQLRQQGHEAVIHDRAGLLGGKIASVIPESRIPKEVLTAELERVRKVIPHADLLQNLDREAFEGLKNTFDFLVVATGAQKPRTLPIPGNQRLITAADFLAKAKAGAITPGKRLVVIGAGNVGCDVATEAHRLGATVLTLIDVQEPAAFGRERKEAEAVGATFRWPCLTKEITADGVVLDSGELIPADTVVISIGDMPDLDFLPEDIDKDRGFVKVDDWFQTSDPKIFAIGDAVRPGLLTDAIGAGRTAATAINNIIAGQRSLESGMALKKKQMIDRSRVSLEYFDPRISELNDPQSCGSQCASCGACRDCGICVAVCPQAAIERVQKQGPDYEYRVDPDKCIGCGFCAGACPCGVWEMAANMPLE